MVHSIATINAMNRTTFTQALGAIFEDTPSIADQVWPKRPFTDVTELHQKMIAIVRSMTTQQQLTLIRAHPDLGSKAKMAVDSIREQSGVGLDRLNKTEYDRFHNLNQTYRNKFGFPFIIAVKNQTISTILVAFEQRIQNSVTMEIDQAIAEICQIARFRLDSTIDL